MSMRTEYRKRLQAKIGKIQKVTARKGKDNCGKVVLVANFKVRMIKKDILYDWLDQDDCSSILDYYSRSNANLKSKKKALS